MNLFKKRMSGGKNNTDGEKPKEPPLHIGIIMDGNGRWAKGRRLPRSAGHAKGAAVFRDIVRRCGEIGVKYLTVYAFSTENWKRPKEEIDALLKLFNDYIDEIARDYRKYNMKIRFLGELSSFSSALKEKIRHVEEKTAGMPGIQVNVALNYGGRQEILQAVRSICKDVNAGAFDIDSLDEDSFSDYLYTANQPYPDLIIRPSGEKRLSNFLLWQSAYAEYVYMDVLWPDFTGAHLLEAIDEYHSRKRRFGGL